ncbi:MAG: hypothetical protein CM1200mP41_36420 [Gammaproteobacteria bacterium]|nr:MAG: hypothetical protein CM1200mP41_36420 [Gammaproteobacteria bacterium]
MRELEPILRGPVFREPGIFGVYQPAFYFWTGIGGSRKFDLEFQGRTRDILSVANRAFRRIMKIMPRKEGPQMASKSGT